MDPVVNHEAERQIPVARPYLAGRKGKFLAKCLADAWISSGQMVEQFESRFASQNSSLPAHGIACNSGTTALHLALVASGVKSGDRVAIPTLTMVAVANAVRYCGAVPVFIDSLLGRSAGNVDPLAMADKSSDCNAVVIPHLYGVPSLAKYELRASGYQGTIIQDCAECHYATYQQLNGSSTQLLDHPQDVLTFSFYANKIIATGEGGMVVTANPTQASRLRSLRAHAFTPGNHFHHQEMAFGYRMTDLQAAIGLAQIQRYRKLLRIRRQVAERYIAKLSSVPWLQIPPRPTGSVWWVFPILVKRAHANEFTVERVRAVLAERGIETRRYFKPLHTQPHLSEFVRPDQTFDVADDLYRRGLYLPLYVGLKNDDVDYVCEAIKSV